MTNWAGNMGIFYNLFEGVDEGVDEGVYVYVVFGEVIGLRAEGKRFVLREIKGGRGLGRGV